MAPFCLKLSSSSLLCAPLEWNATLPFHEPALEKSRAAAEISDRIAVMYAGRFVETATAREIMRSPRHPCTQGLLASTVHGGLRGRVLETIQGTPPNLAQLPPGCAFAPRCRYTNDRCTHVEWTPTAAQVGDVPVTLSPTGTMVRCVRAVPVPAQEVPA